MRGTALLKHRQSAVPHKHQSSELKSLWTQGKTATSQRGQSCQQTWERLNQQSAGTSLLFQPTPRHEEPPPKGQGGWGGTVKSKGSMGTGAHTTMVSFLPTLYSSWVVQTTVLCSWSGWIHLDHDYWPSSSFLSGLRTISYLELLLKCLFIWEHLITTSRP